MPEKIRYCVTRVPSNDWDNIMETVTLDGSYSEEIKNEIWAATENMEDFSNPWVVIRIKNGEASAKIFNNRDSAQKHIDNAKRKSLAHEEYFCIKGQYQGRY